MKRLLKSYKFKSAVLGTISALLCTKFEVDPSVILAVVGLWMAIIGGQAWKDATQIKTTRTVGGEIPPTDDED